MRKIALLIMVFIFSNVVFSQKSIKDIVENTSVAVNSPEHMDPVCIGAVLVDSNKEGEKVLVLKTNIMQGYHIYAYVPAGEAYITSQLGIDLPKGAKLVGNWEKSSPQGYPGKPGLLVYKDQNTFYHSIHVSEVEKGQKLTCWLYYQCCDASICFPPQKKEIELKF